MRVVRILIAITVILSLGACAVRGPGVKVVVPGAATIKPCPPGQAKKGNC